MKKIVLSFILVVCTFLNSAHSQVIDSVTVELIKYRDLSYGPWEYKTMKTDSFSSGLLYSHLHREWNGFNWMPYSVYSYNYSSGLLSNSLFSFWVSNQWQDSLLWTYTYSPQADSIITQTLSGNWVNDSLKIFYSNSIGLDSVVMLQLWDSTAWVNRKLDEYVYAPDSTYLSHTISFYNTAASQWNYFERTLYEKDSLGNDTSIIIQQFITGVWTNFMKYSMIYSGNLVSERREYYWSDFDSSFSSISMDAYFLYDSLGRIVFADYDGFPGGYSDHVYTYDSTGNLVNLHIHSESQSGYVNEYNYEYLFLDFPNSSTIYLYSLNDTIERCSNDTLSAGFFAIGGTAPLQFQWSPASLVSNDTIENPDLIIGIPAMITVTVTDAAMQSASDSIYVVANQPPAIVSIQSIPSCIGCNNGKFVLNVNQGSSPVYHYWFAPPGQAVPVDTIENLAPGIYVLCVVDYNGCEVCETDTIFESNVVIIENEDTRIKLFPNPFDDKVYVNISEEGNDEIYINIMDVSGRLIKTFSSDRRNCELDLSSLMKGIYFFNVQFDESTGVMKIIKQ